MKKITTTAEFVSATALNCSANGNPRFCVTFRDLHGERIATTGTDCACGYDVNNWRLSKKPAEIVYYYVTYSSSCTTPDDERPALGLLGMYASTVEAFQAAWNHAEKWSKAFSGKCLRPISLRGHMGSFEDPSTLNVSAVGGYAESIWIYYNFERATP